MTVTARTDDGTITYEAGELTAEGGGMAADVAGVARVYAADGIVIQRRPPHGREPASLDTEGQAADLLLYIGRALEIAVEVTEDSMPSWPDEVN